MGPSHDDVARQLTPAPCFVKKHINPANTFSFIVNAFGHHLTQSEQIARMAHFSFLFTPDIKANLRDADVRLIIFEVSLVLLHFSDIGTLQQKCYDTTQKWAKPDSNAAVQLETVYFGRAVTRFLLL